MAEIASAYIQLIPSLEGAKNTITSELSDTVQSASKSSSGLLSSLTNGVVSVGKAILSTTASAVSSVVSMTATGGWDRALNLENAQAKMKALGYTTDEVAVLMDAANAAVSGTAYSLSDAATAASSMAAAGVDMEEMEQTLTNISSVAAITGSEYSDISAIFGKVAANGKVTAYEMNQLANAGLDVRSALADEMGVAVSEVSDLVSSGAVTWDVFNSAMSGMGDAAIVAADTLTGATANMKTALSRLGEKLISGVDATDLLKESALSATSAIDILKNGLLSGQFDTGAFQQSMNNIVSNLSTLIQNISTTITTMAPVLAEAIPEIIKTLTSTLLSSENINAIINAAVTLIMALVQGLIDSLPAIIDGITNLITALIEKIGDQEFITQLLEMGFLLISTLALSLGQNLPVVIQAITDVITSLIEYIAEPSNQYEILRQTVLLITQIALGILQCIGSIASAMGQILTQIIKSIVGWFIKVYNKAKEIGTQIINGMIAGLKNLASSVWNWIKSQLNNVWDNVLGFFGIKSPSRLAADAFGYVVAGMVKGLEDNGDNLNNAMMDTVQDAWNTLDNEWDKQLSLSNFDISPDVSASVDNGLGFNNITIINNQATALDDEATLLESMRRAKAVLI